MVFQKDKSLTKKVPAQNRGRKSICLEILEFFFIIIFFFLRTTTATPNIRYGYEYDIGRMQTMTRLPSYD